MEITTDPFADIHDLPNPERIQREVEQARAEYRAQADVVLAKINALTQARMRRVMEIGNLAAILAPEPARCERLHCCTSCRHYHNIWNSDGNMTIGWKCAQWRHKEMLDG